MSSCCHHSWVHKIADYVGYGGLELLLGVAIISIFGSFVHCIGMCGPIASARYSMKLMSSAKPPGPKARLKMAIDYSYYIGKALSYIVISSVLYFLSFKLKSHHVAKYIIFIGLIIISLLFLIAAFNFNALNRLASSLKFNKKFGIYAKKFNLLSGFVLGFIPCGYLYAVLAMVALKAESFIIVLLATIIFGFGTVPGLFLVAVAGNGILLNYKRLFGWFFKLSMLVNVVLIMRYAIKLL